MTAEKRLIPTGQCWCGCGEETGRGSFFRQGHDKIAESRLLKMLYGPDEPVARFLDRKGYGPHGKNLASEFTTWAESDRVR